MLQATLPLAGSLDVMNYLASRPDIDIYAGNDHECTAIHWATATGNVDVCRWYVPKYIPRPCLRIFRPAQEAPVLVYSPPKTPMC